MTPVNTLGVSLRERVISRIAFYICVTFTMWFLNRIAPEPMAQENAYWEHVSPPGPLIAVPLSELTFIPSR